MYFVAIGPETIGVYVYFVCARLRIGALVECNALN